MNRNDDITLPPSALQVWEALDQRGFECFAVGGCVRDSLRGVTSSDWDLTTNATVAEMKAAFNASGLPWVPTGESHGTLTVPGDSGGCEVTTYRIDGSYRDGRHPDSVTFTRSLTEDLARRDFTINALAWSPRCGLVDAFHGLEDLDQKVIRAVGDPQKRFTEDGLRILRALRFAAILDFTIDEGTVQALHRCARLVESLSRERIYGEVTKLILASDAKALSQLLNEFTDVIAYGLPELSSRVFDGPELSIHGNIGGHRFSVIAYTPPELDVRLAALCLGLIHGNRDEHLSEQDATQCMATQEANRVHTALRHLRAPRKVADNVAQLIAFSAAPVEQDRMSVRRRLVQCGSVERYQAVLALRKAEAQAFDPEPAAELAALEHCAALASAEEAAGMVYHVKDLAITGADLMARGWSSGAGLGRCLHRLFNAVVDLQLENRKECLLAASDRFKSCQ